MVKKYPQVNRLWLILSATVVVLTACTREETRVETPEFFDLSSYSFVIDASLSDGPATRLVPTTGAWQNGDKIYISVDGSDSNVYLLQYDAKGQVFGIYNVTGASNAGFGTSGSLTGLFCQNPSLKMQGGKLQGTTLGDLAYTTAGSYSKSGSTIHISLQLATRPVSILKVEGCGGSCFVENMTCSHTSLTSLASMTWDESVSGSSFVYDAAEDATWCYGTLPEGGLVKLRYTGGEKQLMTRTYTGRSLATGKMATLQGPSSSQAAQWAEDFSEYYETGEVITYRKAREQKPYTIVVLGDGYTVYDLRHGGVFETAARRSLDYLFNLEPYDRMLDLFNVYIIPARSNERGATIKSTGQTRDTYFGLSWTSKDSYTDMDVSNSSTMKSFVRTHCPDISQGINSLTGTAILILSNESTYAGLCRSQSDGQAYCMLSTPSRALAWNNPLGITKTSGSYLNLVAHEFGGHAIGRLGDEYFHDGDGTYSPSLFNNPLYNEHHWSVPASRNLTSDTSDCEWDWMASNGYTGEGLYEGGYAQYANGIWRPEIISCMFDNRPYFNAWSRYLIMERVYGVCGETFNRSVFLSKDSGISQYDEQAATRSSIEEVEGPVQFVPMLPSPVFCEVR